MQCSREESSTPGSSPLARGLRSGSSCGRCASGIIPARAGFTTRRAGTPREPRDHPRSRGVYTRSEKSRTSEPGSSPLARGLRGGRLRPDPRHRIIPARAGFTQNPYWPCREDRDHPRSRGVYVNEYGRKWGYTGSSPLARGLRQRVRAQVGVHGIIPARAGFTGCTGMMRPGRSDHPRSRGVYLATMKTMSG